MLDQSSSRYKNVLSSPSQAAKIKNLDLFKNKIKEEIKKKNHCKSYLKLDSIKEYGDFSSEFRDFSLDMALLLLQDNAEVQTIKEKLIKFKNNTKGTHSIKSGKRTVYLQGEDIKAFEKRVEKYVKYKNMQYQVAYSKIEDSGDLLLHNVENAIYYIYHYLTKALDLQKKDGKKEAEKNKKSEAINSCEQTPSDEKKDNALGNNDLNIKQEFLSDNTIDGNILSSIKGIDDSCQDSSIDSTNEITLLKEQVNPLSRENTQLQGELKDVQQQLTKCESENNELQTKLQEFASKNKELEIEVQENRIQKLEELKSTTNGLNAMLEKFEDILVRLCEEKEELRQELNDTQQNLTKKTNELEGTKAQFAKLQQNLDMKTSEVIELKGRTNSAKQHLDTEIKESINIKAQLEKLQRELTKKTEELENISKKLDDANQKISQLERECDDAQQQLKVLQNENKELKSKNKEASTVNTQGIKGKVNYTSASFILFGVCTTGASLTIPYLAACITLAIAASTFLVAGLYCSYKVNTALSNVETDQQNKPLLESSI